MRPRPDQSDSLRNEGRPADGGPDFVVVGAMKCATSTLHSQLAQQPGIFMSEPKEPNFFSDDTHYRRGWHWYASLFASAGTGALCGESSTHYTKLPTYPHSVSRIRAHLPDVKLIYVMRHPIERLVSHYVHEWSQRVISMPIGRAIERHSELVDYGRYAMQLKPYREAFSDDQILLVFFERLTSRPQEELERVCQFLGYSGRPVWNDSTAVMNASRQRLRKGFSRRLLVDAPLMTTLRRTFVPRSVRQRIKRLWSIGDRPHLDNDQVVRLKQVYDEDLRLLSDWLRFRITCDTFREVTVRHQPKLVAASLEGAR